MKTFNCSTSACRCCRYYQPEGRRGGMCQQLSVPVRGSWKACSLAISPFAPNWDTISGFWEDEALGIKGRVKVNCAIKTLEQDIPKNPSLSTSETLEPEIVLI